jgi:hypothetical protein
MASTWPWLNSWESWFQSPTSSQGLGSKKSPITLKKGLITLKFQEVVIKPTSNYIIVTIWLLAPFAGRGPSLYGHMALIKPWAININPALYNRFQNITKTRTYKQILCLKTRWLYCLLHRQVTVITVQTAT